MSFRLKTIFGIALIEFVVMALLILMNQWNFGGTASSQLFNRAELTARLFSTMVSDAVISTDLATLDSMIESTLTNDELIYLRVRGSGGIELSGGGDADVLATPFSADSSFDDALNDHRIDVAHPIAIGGQEFGRVELGISTDLVEAEIANAVRWNVAGAVVGMGLVAIFGYLLGSILTRQLSILRDGAMALEGGRLDMRIPVKGSDELAQTAECFNLMASSLAQDRAALLDRQGVLLEKKERVEEIVERMRVISQKQQVDDIPSREREDEIGDMARATAVFRDTMTEIESVRRQQARLIEAFERLNEEVVIFGTEGANLFGNQAFKRSNSTILEALPSAYSAEEFLVKGLELEEFFKPTQQGQCTIEELRKTFIDVDGFCEVARPGGRRSLMRTTHIEGLGTIITASDVTELRDSQAQLVHASKLATLGEMAAGMAHELNQPLGVIRMAAGNCMRRMAQDRLEPDYLKGKLERMVGQTERAARIIDHMRIFGRRDDARAMPFDVGAAITSATSLMRSQLSGTSISLVEEAYPENIWTTGPAIMFEQVIMNVILNARDAIVSNSHEQDHPSGVIRVSMQKFGDDRCRIQIADSGGGIPEDVIARLYEPFFTTKDPGKGTGLGLSIGYSVIQEMDGEISVKNEDGGAVFSITCPLYVSESAPNSAETPADLRAS